MSKLKEILDFFAKSFWTIDESTPDYIKDYFNRTWGKDAPSGGPDTTPIFHKGIYTGTRQDIIDGNLDPTDESAWKP